MITKEKLLDFGFVEKNNRANTYYEKNSFILLPELGKWFICANHSGLILSDLTWIETIVELKKAYFESLGEELN